MNDSAQPNDWIRDKIDLLYKDQMGFYYDLKLITRHLSVMKPPFYSDLEEVLSLYHLTKLGFIKDKEWMGKPKGVLFIQTLNDLVDYMLDHFSQTEIRIYRNMLMICELILSREIVNVKAS